MAMVNSTMTMVKNLWRWSFRALWNDYGLHGVDYNHHDVTIAIVSSLQALSEGHHHITKAIMFTTIMLDVLRPWSSDRVFKFSGKSVIFHYFHLIEQLCIWKTKLAPKHEFCQKKCMQIAQNITAKVVY